MEYLHSLTSRRPRVVAVRRERPPPLIRESDARSGFTSGPLSERQALVFGASTSPTHSHAHGEAVSPRRCAGNCSRDRGKHPETGPSSNKHAVQMMNRLDSLVQLHAAKIGGRFPPTSPTTTQVLQFVTLVDATGRKHPIPIQCCISFEQLQAMLRIVLKSKSRDALVQRRYFDAGLYDLCIDKGAQVVQKQRSCKLYKCHLCGASNKVDCRTPTDWSGWLTDDSIDCRECGARFQIFLDKKNGKKAPKSFDIDDDARSCIRNFRVDAVKRVAFCCDGTEEIHEADDWDRSPAPIVQQLTFGDMLELKALQRDLYLAPQAPNPTSLLLPRVPIPLLRLNP